MGKFNNILYKKIDSEKIEEEKQAALKKDAGISPDANVEVKKKGVLDYAKSVGTWILYLVFIVLVFIGIFVVITPGTREILFSLVGLV